MKLSHKIKFDSTLHSDFIAELKEKVDSYFVRKGCSRKANRAMIAKMTLIFLLFLTTYLALLSNRFSTPVMLLLAVLFGFSNVLIAFNIGHDASHGALFNNPKWNKFFSHSFNLIGVNSYIWHIKHNISHHSYTNIPHLDMDNEQIKIARLVKHVPSKWYYRYQHIYLPLLYPFTSLFNIFLKDFIMFSTIKFGVKKFEQHSRKEYLILIISKLFYFIYILVIPLMIIELSWWKILIGFMIMHLVLGTLIAIILFPAHANDDSPFPEPDQNGIIHNHWIVHQIETSTNFGVNSKLLFWITGGLNIHIVHHIFPAICHIHYYDLTPIVRDCALKYSISFREKTILQSFFSHLRFLKKMGNVQAQMKTQLIA